MDSEALRGVRVADFSWAIAAPIATWIMALMGAEVIKIESARRPDHLRTVMDTFGVHYPSLEACPIFNQLNLNKLNVSIDLRKPEGLELVKRIIGISDVVVENFSAGVMDRLGLGYEALREVKPDIVMVSQSASGSSGPWKGIVANAAVFGSLGGLTFLSGYPDLGPTEVGPMNDPRTATVVLFAVMAALCHHKKTGEGQYVDLSSVEAQTCFVGDIIMDYVINQRIPERMGNHDAVMAPHNCYPCLGDDQWVTIAVASEEEWQALCNVIGESIWTRSEKFGDAYRRKQNETELDNLITEWTSQHNRDELVEAMQKAGVAAFRSSRAEDIFHDKHLWERDYFTQVEHPAIGRQTVISSPWKFSQTPVVVKRAAALVGQDNEYVLGQLLGKSKDEMVRLKEQEVIFDKF